MAPPRQVRVMTADDKRELAQVKGVSVATINRWIRCHGEAAAREMTRTSPSEAARRARSLHPEYVRHWWAR
jgi:hypothetical protein